MFTVCPKCALTLVVTAADLRVAQGYVRCGRCLNVFNALARLSEERPGAAPAEAAPATAEAPPQASAPSPTSAADDTGEIEIELDASILVTAARPPAGMQAAVEPESEPAQSPPAGSPPAESASSGLAPSAAISESSEPTEPPAQPAEPAEPMPGPAMQDARDAAATTAPEPTQTTNTAQSRSDESFELVPGRSRPSLAWRLGAGALALALALQIVNHYRDELAARPALGAPLRAVYSALDVKLAPRWNVRAYDVRQLGASVGGATPGEIVVRASVKNAASHPQPLPLLRVTLQDRFGNRIAARDVPPRDYLPSSVASSSLLAAGSRVDATMVFVDPGPQAVGFEIDACLPIAGAQREPPAGLDETRAVACAHAP